LDTSLSDIADKVHGGERLNAPDGVALFRSLDILTLGSLANEVRERLNGNRTYYVINRHINYTNVCINRCPLCAFSCHETDAAAYVLPIDQMASQAAQAAAEGATEIHVVGGLHPRLPFSYYVDMLRAMGDAAPSAHLQAFTAVEIAHFATISGKGVGRVLEELRRAGLGSLPGGGAEVFSERVRREICPRKLAGREWLDVMRQAHLLGIKSNATMLYGHVETVEERVDHLLRLRDLQDETGGFLAFIPLKFHPENTGLAHVVPAGGVEDLKMYAVSRLLLDNFPHIKAFWIMLGVKLAQVAQWFGADDLDGTVIEEKITHAAGATTPQSLTVSDLRALIEETGREAVERNTLYEMIDRNLPPKKAGLKPCATPILSRCRDGESNRSADL
jgi:aminodeoxyfutalosine synthase